MQPKTYGTPTKVKPLIDLSVTYRFRLWPKRSTKLHGSHLKMTPRYDNL